MRQGRGAAWSVHTAGLLHVSAQLSVELHAGNLPCVQYKDSDSVQCTGCLALLALLRGEGPASDTARQRMEDGAVISTVAEGGLATY